MGNKVGLIFGLSGSLPEPILQGGQRTNPAEKLDAGRPNHGRDMYPQEPAPAQDKQRAGYGENNESKVDQEGQIGEPMIKHYGIGARIRLRDTPSIKSLCDAFKHTTHGQGTAIDGNVRMRNSYVGCYLGYLPLVKSKEKRERAGQRLGNIVNAFPPELVSQRCFWQAADLQGMSPRFGEFLNCLLRDC